jgi:hypothetical protein
MPAIGRNTISWLAIPSRNHDRQLHGRSRRSIPELFVAAFSLSALRNQSILRTTRALDYFLETPPGNNPGRVENSSSLTFKVLAN